MLCRVLLGLPAQDVYQTVQTVMEQFTGFLSFYYSKQLHNIATILALLVVFILSFLL